MYYEWDHASALQTYEGLDHSSTMHHRFHTAMYRVLLAGAVLTRPYLEPMFLASTQGPPGLLERCRLPDCQWSSHAANADLEYLERFPVYNLEANMETWEPAFGHLAQWLLDDMKTTAVRVESGGSYNSMLGRFTPEERGWLQEVMFFLAAYEHMIDKLFNKFIKDPDDENLEARDFLPPPFPGSVRHASIAMFGIFRPETVSMPSIIQDASRCYLINHPLGHEPGSGEAAVLPPLSPWTVDNALVLDRLWGESGRPNMRDGCPSPQPALRFVEFMLRKFFGVGIRHEVFDPGNRHLDYYVYGFLLSDSLFEDRSVMEMGLLDEYKEPSLSFQYQ